MKRSNNKGIKFKPRYLSFALACALVAPNLTMAQNGEQPAFNLLGSVDRSRKGDQLLRDVSDFARRTTRAMENPSTREYLENKPLADSSTFALRLFSELETESFQQSPFLPVPDDASRCYYGVPPYIKSPEYDSSTEPINITSDSVQGTLSHNVVYQGNVVITQADRKLNADQASYDELTGTVTASGDIKFTSGEYTVVTTQPVTNSVPDGVSTVQDATYQLHGSVVRGHTNQMVRDDQNQVTTFQDLTFTTCPVDDNSWRVVASEVEIRDNESHGTAKHSVMYMGPVPVFYMPYAQFPVTSERQSGLLYPSASYSSANGFDYAQPIYFNIAPNYDLTLTPRVMTKRSASLDTEFRFLPFENNLGKADFIYTPNDREWEKTVEEEERWFLNVDNSTHFLNKDLTFNVKYQRVRPGDYDFLSDYGPDNTRVTDNHLTQSFKAAYNRYNYDVSLEARKYQQLLPDNAVSVKPFSMLPQLKGAIYDSSDAVAYNVDFEATQFQSEDEDVTGYYTASRLHVEPGVYYKLYNNRGTTLDAGVRGFLTQYNQDEDKVPHYFSEEFNITSLEENKTRALYLLDVKGKTTLERKVLDLRHTQTLEPMVAYQYIPYREQQHIGLYDTTDRMTDYYSIFSHRTFTGNDRIADLNRVTAGFSTRLLDAHDREIYNFSIGQAYNFVPTRVNVYTDDDTTESPRSPLAVLVNANPFDDITVHADMSYTNETNDITSWNAMTEYKNREGYLAQLNYRYTKEGNRSLEDDEIIDLSQLGLQVGVPLGGPVKAIGAVYRDMEQEHNIDYKVALKFEECCYAVSLVYENYSKTNWTTLSRDDETIVGVEIEFKGMVKVNMSGSEDTDSTDTYLLSYFNPTNLSQ